MLDSGGVGMNSLSALVLLMLLVSASPVTSTGIVATRYVDYHMGNFNGLGEEESIACVSAEHLRSKLQCVMDCSREEDCFGAGWDDVRGCEHYSECSGDHDDVLTQAGDYQIHVLDYSCGDGYERVNGMCLYFSYMDDDKKRPEPANMVCLADGANLAAPTEVQNGVIKSYLRLRYEDVDDGWYIAFKSNPIGGTVVKLNLQSVNYDDFAPGHQVSTVKTSLPECVYYLDSHDDYKWGLGDCSEKRYFICMKPPAAAGPP